MRCSQVQNRLPEYAAGALASGEAARVAAHLEACVACRRELTGLEIALHALDGARPAAPPDLWPEFRRRAAAADCPAVAPLLPAYAAAELPVGEARRVAEHLDLCGPCSAEAAGLERSLAACAPAAAPDLWGAFSARLGAGLPCRVAGDLLPAFQEGEIPAAQARELAAHLTVCPACAAGNGAYRRSTEALGRVAAAPVQVDLWPAFAARLEAETVPRRPAVRPALRPAFALAGCAVLALLAAPTLFSRRGVPAGPVIARAPAPGPNAVSPAPAPEGAIRPGPSASAATTARPRPPVRAVRRPAAARRPAPAPRPAPPAGDSLVVMAVAEPAPSTSEPWGGLQVAFNPDLPRPAVLPVAYEPSGGGDVMSGATRAAVRRDFEMLAAVLDDIREAAAAPLEPPHD